jgi:hypothetical protein
MSPLYEVGTRDATIRRLRRELREARRVLAEVLERDSIMSPSGGPTGGCGCISYSREFEREYETGACPHQRAAALAKPTKRSTSDRCPHCSFQPTTLSDYCEEHRPKEIHPKPTKRRRTKR